MQLVESELLFKIVLIILFSLFSIIRIRYQLLAKKTGYRTVIEESKKYSILLSLLICYEVFTLFLYLLYPGPIIWANISLALWLRLTGVVLGILSLLLFIWVHRHLGKDFSIKLRVTDQQTLIDTGPYYWIRHPMYIAFYLLHMAAFLLTANWFIGLTWLVGLNIIITLRVRREEAMMLERFGEEYNLYMISYRKILPSC